MSKNLFGIGIIGCGNISDVQAQAIRESANGKLVSAFSRTETNLKRITDKYGINGFMDLGKFLNDDELDAVSICTPSGTHLDYAVKAAVTGKHVIIEKPIEVTIERANQIIDVCRKNNVRLAVIYQNRFIDDVIKMKKSIDDGDIGQIFLADAYVKWFRSQDYYDSADWRGTFELDGGGVLINQAIHTIDLLVWLAGDIESINGQVGTFTHNNIEGEDNAVAALKFESGAIGVLEASTSAIPAFKRKIELHGDKGTAVLEGNKFQLLKSENAFKQESEESENTGGASPLAGFSIEPHKKQFEQIIEAIITGNETVVSGSESLKSLAVVKAVYESSAKNKTVYIKDFLNK